MCEFFSCIATRSGKILFTEKNSHETIIERAGLADRGDILRIEYNDHYGFDYNPNFLLEWYARNRLYFEKRIRDIFKIVGPAHKKCERLKAQAWEEFYKIINQNFEFHTLIEAQKEREKLGAQAQKEYKKRICKIKGYIK